MCLFILWLFITFIDCIYIMVTCLVYWFYLYYGNLLRLVSLFILWYLLLYSHCDTLVCFYVSHYVIFITCVGSIIYYFTFPKWRSNGLVYAYMSFLPVYKSLAAGALLLCLFLWNISVFPLVLIMLIGSLIFFWLDLMNTNLHYESAFWLFIFSEVMAFGSLIACCVWFDTCYYINLSSPLEIPLIGSFILLGSSITVTGYHHLIGWKYDFVLLGLTIFLGLGFVVLQLIEMNEISIKIFDTAFHASSFCTVGLHFSHVVLGVVALITVFWLGSTVAGFYRCSLVTWYWHFVDYVWLFVYTFVYVCYYK